MQCKEITKLKYLSCSLKHFIPKATMLQPNDINSDVHLTNSYTHAKFERVLSDIYRDIHHFMNLIYYS